MPSCRVILKKLARDKRITTDEYDKLLRNLKPQITKEDAIDYLHQIRWMQAHDKEIYKQGYECGKNERKTGKWIVWQDCEGKTRTYTCPICGNERRSWSAPIYCENCGERMEVDE
jgi:hypothetical protein